MPSAIAFGALYLAGILVFYLVVSWTLLATASTPPPGRFVAFEITLLYGVSMLIASRFLYALAHWSSPVGMWGGYAFFLVVLVGYLGFGRVPRGAVLDAVAVALPTALAVAKLGCSFAGCCYGTPTHLPWAIHFPEGTSAPANVDLHPTQYYDMAVLCVAALAARRIARDRPNEGRSIVVSLLILAVGRFATEFTRGDHTPRVVANLTYTQLVCLAVATLGTLLLTSRQLQDSYLGWTGAPREPERPTRAPAGEALRVAFLSIAIGLTWPLTLCVLVVVAVTQLVRRVKADGAPRAAWTARFAALTSCLAATKAVDLAWPQDPTAQRHLLHNLPPALKLAGSPAVISVSAGVALAVALALEIKYGGWQTRNTTR